MKTQLFQKTNKEQQYKTAFTFSYILLTFNKAITIVNNDHNDAFFNGFCYFSQEFISPDCFCINLAWSKR